MNEAIAATYPDATNLRQAAGKPLFKDRN